MTGKKYMDSRAYGNGLHEIDKTEALERGIEVFPSIYIEGAAAVGKTTALRMLAAKHPEARVVRCTPEELTEKLSEAAPRRPGMPADEKDSAARKAIASCGQTAEAAVTAMETQVWYVLDDFPAEPDGAMVDTLSQFIRQISEKGENTRVLLAGREKPPGEFLDLVWKRQMQLIPQEALRFSEAETEELVRCSGSGLDPAELFRETGGWAGCTDMLIRLAEDQSEKQTEQSESEAPGYLRRLKYSWEIASYIDRQILDTLPENEREIMRRAAVCPWISAKLCREVWGISWADTLLENLERKGLLHFDREMHRWTAASILQGTAAAGRTDGDRRRETDAGARKYLGRWYEEHGFLPEALACMKDSGDEETYRECLLRHYREAPWLGLSFPEVLQWKGNRPELCYLRGLLKYREQDVKGLDAELERLSVKPEDNRQVREIYLNLAFLKTDLSMEGWMKLLEEYGREKEGLRLYHMLGNSWTFLCGLRDLSALFACAKNEERALAKIWKDRLGPEEWQNYQLARIDYYLETERREKLLQEDRELLKRGDGTPEQRLAKLYLWCRLRRLELKDGRQTEDFAVIRQLEESLVKDSGSGDPPMYAVTARAIRSLYAFGREEQNRLAEWLRSEEAVLRAEVCEENYAVLCCMAKAYLQRNRYEKTGLLLKRLLPYMQAYRRRKFQAELLFEQAVVHQSRGMHGLALRSAIESFVAAGDRRYVRFYAEYGKYGYEVMEAYVDWLSKNTPGGWHRKKRYNYGNVLHMKREDYLGVVLRCAKKGVRTAKDAADDRQQERLTMMETVILQGISQGLSNTEICSSLNLKLPTVKSHIYNLYKKLGAGNRVQAVNRAKELGIL